MSEPTTAPAVATRKTRGDPLDGVLLLDKPPGVSSNTALQHSKRLLGARKAGHTGTLDPMATGLLPICFGEATKFAANLLDADKTYEAVVKLGVTTATGDAEGEITARAEVGAVADRLPAVMAGLTGAQQQVPPMYSALKRQGRSLYEYARAGQMVERAARQIEVRELAWRVVSADEVWLRVRVSKGTYIRVLAEEVGTRLGCGAHLSALRRTAIAALDVQEAVTLKRLEALPLLERREALRPVDFLALDLPALEVAQADRLLHGQPVGVGQPAPCGLVRLYDTRGRFLGVGEVGADGCVAPKRLLAVGQSALPA
jgi:tRNA pseudouridine55 synthase